MNEFDKNFLLLVKDGKFDDYIACENQYYLTQIKPIENPQHYDKMYSAVEQSGIAYGREIKKIISVNNDVDNHKICYFLPSLDSDLAHIELLTAILKDSKKFGYTIYVAGFSNSKESIQSKQLRELEINGVIRIIPISFSHADIIHFLNVFVSLKISQLVITSVPVLIMSFLEVLGESRVTWLSMKFELSCFTGLRNRISFCAPTLSTYSSNGIKWHRTPPKIVGSKTNWIKRASSRSLVKIVTINREEKIHNELFLNSVRLILNRNPSAHFYWTGRNCDERIEKYFFVNDMSNRCHFIGWVAPEQVISEFDIFLDTPFLSGSIAAKVFADGMPVATYKNSQSWVDFYADLFNQELRLLGESNGVSSILFNGIQDYCGHVDKLINNEAYYTYISSLQTYLGKKYFSNSSEMSTAHFNALDDIIFNQPQS